MTFLLDDNGVRMGVCVVVVVWVVTDVCGAHQGPCDMFM